MSLTDLEWAKRRLADLKCEVSRLQHENQNLKMQIQLLTGEAPATTNNQMIDPVCPNGEHVLTGNTCDKCGLDVS